MGRCTHFNSSESVRRDLHDQIGSPLAGLIMEVDLARQLIKKRDSDGAYGVLTNAHEDIIELMAQIRRIISNTDGPQSECWDAELALRTMIRRMNRAVAPRLLITLKIDPEIRTVGNKIGWTAFWIIREAVTNVLKHSTAQNCLVALQAGNDGVRVVIVDDGNIPLQPWDRGGYGLSNMAARAEELGGWCVTAPGGMRGFIVTAYLPHTQKTSRRTESL